ncbi:MAG: PAS domain-containing sensor histidine kinase [Promethearchaeota archaeon]
MKSVSSRNIKEQERVEEELRLLSQYAQDAIIQMDGDSLVTYWNKSAEKLFGYTDKEILGKNLHSIIVPERYHHAHNIGFSKFKKSGQGATINKTLELEGLRKDGAEFPIELSLSAVLIKGEWNTIGIIRDITTRKITEKRLKDSEKKYKILSNELELILDNIPALIFYKDNDNKFIRVNKYIADAYKMKKEDLIGKSLFELYPREVTQAYLDDDLEVITSGKPKLNYEEPWKTADGLRWALTSKIPLFEVNGEVTGLIGTSIDITELKNAEKKLRESEERYRSLFKYSFSGIAFHKIIYDSKDKPINYSITDVNPKFETITQLKREEVLNKLATEVYKVSYPPYLEIYSKVAETLEPISFNVFFEPMNKYFKISAFSYEKGKFITVFEDVTQEKLKEIELKEAHSEIEQIFNTSVPFYVIDKNLTIIRINDSFCSLFQVKRDEIIGNKCYSLWNSANCKSTDCLISQFANNIERFDYEMEKELEDGTKIFCMVKSFPYRDSSGEIVGSIKNFINITKRKSIEEKLKRSLETTKKILDLLPIGIVLIGYDKKIESVNKVALKLLKIDDEFEILGRICHQNICPAEIGSCPIIDLGQKVDYAERILINRFGKQVPILKSVMPITLGDKNYLLESFVDISSLKETQEKLKESQEKYRDLLETSLMGILDINLVSREIGYFNPKLLELIGYSKEELHDSNLFYKIAHPEDIQKLFKSRDDGDIEFRINTKDGKTKWIAGNRLFQYNKKGELIKLRLWMQDISERKKGESLKRLFTEKLEKEVQSRTKDLLEALKKQKLYLDQIEKSSRFKTEFMATMSHELRTPLNAIIGFTALLLESAFGGLNEEQLEFVKDIDESSNHLLEMITTILDISKIEAGQVILTVEEINLNNLVNQIISTLKPLYNEKEIIFDLKGLKKDKFIFADRIKFKQIIYNLLSNAIKFTEKGKVIFEFKENKNLWDFRVIDTGIGIAEKDFNIIFKDFKRVKSAYVDSINGSGLGLALTKRIVNLHGGDLLFTSKLGKGTTFAFTIPIKIRNNVKSEKIVESFLSKL